MKFSCIPEKDLKEVNISSLLFYSGTNICTLEIGNICVDLVVNGDIRIIDERTGDIYKNYGAFTDEMKTLIREKKRLEENGYYIDLSNWFEIFITNKNGDELLCEVADIEGELDNNNLFGSLFKFIINTIQDFVDEEDIDYMKLRENDYLLMKKEIKNVYTSYKNLAKIKTGKEDEEIGRNLYLNSNERLYWIKYLDENNTFQHILIEI